MAWIKDFANWLLYILEKIGGYKTKRYKWEISLGEFIFVCIVISILILIYLFLYPFKKILNIKFT